MQPRVSPRTSMDYDLDDLVHVSWIANNKPYGALGHIEALDEDRVSVEGHGWMPRSTTSATGPWIRLATSDDLMPLLRGHIAADAEISAVNGRSRSEDMAACAAARSQ